MRNYISKSILVSTIFAVSCGEPVLKEKPGTSPSPSTPESEITLKLSDDLDLLESTADVGSDGDSSSSLLARSNPCTDESLFACFPDLNRHVVNNAFDIVKVVSAIFRVVDEEIKLKVGSQEKEFTFLFLFKLKAQYVVTENSYGKYDFQVLLSNVTGGRSDIFAFLNFKSESESKRSLYFRAENNKVPKQETASGRTEFHLVAADKSTWDSLKIKVTGVSCKTSDERYPSESLLLGSYSNSIFKGKLMLRHPHGIALSNTCDDSTEYFTYHDFVSKQTSKVKDSAGRYTLASSYVLDANSSLNAIGEFEASAFCTKFASACTAGVLANNDPSLPIAQFSNPHCMAADTVTPEYGSVSSPTASSYSAACTDATVGLSATVGDAKGFGPASDWPTMAVVSTSISVVPEDLPVNE